MDFENYSCSFKCVAVTSTQFHITLTSHTCSPSQRLYFDQGHMWIATFYLLVKIFGDDYNCLNQKWS